MRRRSVVAFSLILALATSLALGQGGGSDRIRFRDRKKDGQETVLTGELQESAAGVRVVAGGKTVTIAPNDVIAVEYARLPGIDPVALRLTEGRDAAKARADYADALKKAGQADPKTRRFLEYKEAMLSARVADGKAGTAFQPEAEAAAEKLTAFARAYPQTWEVWPAARTAARLQAELGRFDDAARTLAALARNKELPGELQFAARLSEIDAFYRGGNQPAAAAAATALAQSPGFPKSGPLAEGLTVYQAVIRAAQTGDDAATAVKAVRGVIDATADPGVRAAAHNALGELFLLKGRPRDALWEFLWVEAVYNQDRDDVAKAVGRLAGVFEKLGDADRAAAYREKLPRAKGA